MTDTEQKKRPAGDNTPDPGAMAEDEETTRANQEPPPAEDDSEAMEPVPDDEAAEAKPDKKKPQMDDAEKSLTERVWQRISDRLGRKEDASDGTGFKVKGDHWIALWSNNFKDRDGEIFTAKAIDAYVKRVDSGIVEPPALAIWHLGKKSYIGQSDFVAREGHFLIAAGTFGKDAKSQKARDYYQKHAKETALSHGFTFPSKQFDGTHYHAFNTFEISLLPRGAEANSYTSLEGVKAMALDDRKKKYLKDVAGYTDAEITQMETDIDQRGKDLEAVKTEFKDFADPTEVVEPDDSALSKALKELVPELIEADADNAQANLKMAKVVAQQQSDLSAIKESLKKIEAFISQTPKRASKAAETEIDPEDEDDAKDFLSRYENGQVDEKLVKALGASAFDQSDFRKSLSQHGINLR